MKRREFSSAAKKKGLQVVVAGDHYYDFVYHLRRKGSIVMTFEMTSRDDVDTTLFTIMLWCKTLNRKWTVRQSFDPKKWDRELLNQFKEEALGVAYTELHHLVWTLEQEEKEAEKRKKFLTKGKSKVD